MFPWKAIAAGAAALGALGIVTLIGRRPSHGSIAPKGVAPKSAALIGDSYAVGLGPPLSEQLLLTTSISTFTHEGRVGIGTTAYRLPAWLVEARPDLVLVSLGVNDGTAPNLANYQAIVRNLHGIGARVVWIEPPAGVRNDAVRQVIASLGVATVPATNVRLAADGLHPAGAGYSTWARAIAKTVGVG